MSLPQPKSTAQSFYITTAKGMEEVLLNELLSIGISAPTLGRAGVSFKGTLRDAYKVCLWSRVANRVLLPLKTFTASNPEKLYGEVRSIRWSDHLGPEQTLAVDFSSSQSEISHTHFGALKTKDAIVDQLRSVKGARPSIDPAHPDVRVNVYLLKNEATVSIDLSGDSLHRRGYREEGATAPLKENLAAGLLLTAGWQELSKDPKAEFLDPMCGSGTLPLEAAFIAARVAPGLGRSYFGFSGWLPHREDLWTELCKEAEEMRIRDRKKLPRVVGFDRDFRAVRVALANSERAGLTTSVHFEKRELAACSPNMPDGRGIIMVNPPYGERIGDIDELRPLYREIGHSFKQKFKGWEGYVFTGSPDLAKEVGLQASRRYVFFNGAIECRLLRYELYSGTQKSEKPGTRESGNT